MGSEPFTQLGVWLRVRWSHWSLDEQLAAGIDPATDPALILRAGELRSARHRRRMASWIERLVGESEAKRTHGLSSALPVVREQVAEARQSLLFLAHLLRSAKRVRPRGMAAVEQMLTDGGSVLYTDNVRGAVELQVRVALDWLVGEEEADPEAWFSVANPNAAELVSR